MGEITEKTLDALLYDAAAAYICSATPRGKIGFIYRASYFIMFLDSVKSHLETDALKHYTASCRRLSKEIGFYRTELSVMRKAQVHYPVGETVENAENEGQLLSNGVEAFKAVFRCRGNTQRENAHIIFTGGQLVASHAANKEYHSKGSHSISLAFEKKVRQARSELYANALDRTGLYCLKDIVEEALGNFQ